MVIRYPLILILTTIILSCCQPSGNQYLVPGEWRIESIKAGHIHACFKVAKGNDTIPGYYLGRNSFFRLFPDGTFSYHVGPNRIVGAYILQNDSLILKTDSVWLRGKVNAVDNHTMSMTIQYGRFYAIQEDSVQFYTGENSLIVLKR